MGAAVVARDTDRGALQQLVRKLAPVCRARGLLLLVAGDWRLARTRGCSGLHLSEAMVRRGARRWRLARPAAWIVTAAAHSPRAVRRAASVGIDAVLMSPVFPTASHPGQRSIGALRFARWAEASSLPVIALGGIDGATARRLSRTPVAGFAAIGALAPADQSVASLKV